MGELAKYASGHVEIKEIDRQNQSASDFGRPKNRARAQSPGCLDGFPHPPERLEKGQAQADGPAEEANEDQLTHVENGFSGPNIDLDWHRVRIWL